MSSSFSSIPDVILDNISSFLLPIDICRFRTLSSYYKKFISIYLLKHYNTTNLFDSVCPKCGNDWISNAKIVNGFEFNDIDEEDDYFDVIERKKSLINMNLSEKSRKHLLCNDCENIWAETSSISSFKLYRFCNYQVYINFYNTRMPWAFLVKEMPNGEKNWNQYNMYIIHIQENMLDFSIEDDDEDDDDDDDEEEEDDDEDDEDFDFDNDDEYDQEYD